MVEAAALQNSLSTMIFSSTIIPTINRATLTRAVLSVLEQDFQAADFEVIVVNDSGAALPEMPWQHSPRVQILNTNRRERCVARNTGAAIAKGKYLHFLDDDDIILPGALGHFWKLSQTTHSAWLYGSYQSVDNDDRLVEEFHPGLNGNLSVHLVAGEGIPFQTSLLLADQFFEVGGFDPTPAIVGVEDRDLGRRMALAGTVAHVPAVVAKIRIGQVGSTTNWAKIAEGDRLGREKALNTQAALDCLWASADTSYWRGRLSRALFASMVWNLKHKNAWIAASRACAGLAVSGTQLPRIDFWRGLGTKIK